LPPQQHELQCHGLLISCNRTAAAQEKSSPSLLSPPVLIAKQKHSRKSDFPQSMQHENESRENDEANTTKTQEDNQRNKTPAQTHNNPQSNKLNATTTTTTTKTAPVVATKKKKKTPTKNQQKLQQTTTEATPSAAKQGIFTNMSSASPTAACHTHSSYYVGFLTYLPTYLPTYWLLIIGSTCPVCK
jgi:hypothetical protein